MGFLTLVSISLVQRTFVVWVLNAGLAALNTSRATTPRLDVDVGSECCSLNIYFHSSSLFAFLLLLDIIGNTALALSRNIFSLPIYAKL